MSYEKDPSPSITPRIIIHGGAGNITRQNLPDKAYSTYRSALLRILQDAHYRLRMPHATALDVAAYAVTQLENNGLFNSGHGAVFTTAGTHELEASVMVSDGYRKRGVGVMGVKRVRNPINLAREMLMRGQEDDGGGAQGHCQLHGETCDRLAEEWGLEMAKPSHFWTRRRWDEHRRGLGLEHDDDTYKREKRKADEHVDAKVDLVDLRADSYPSAGQPSTADVDEAEWDGKEYLPQGTVGAVCMDSSGTICVATSTGGLTNKLPGRIGDTPTLGAGFWAESWTESKTAYTGPRPLTPLEPLFEHGDWLTSCFNGLNKIFDATAPSLPISVQNKRAVAMSGTGNGDSFLRLAAVRTAAAMVRFSPASLSFDSSAVTLQDAVSHVAGPSGMLQESAEDRWLKAGEGEGGIIGIERDAGQGKVVFDYNCGGMFHAWIDDHGRAKFQVFRDRVDDA